MTDISQKDVLEIIRYSSMNRKWAEKKEYYEVCAELRDFENVLSDYLLGYTKRDEMEGAILLFLLSDIDSSLTYCDTELGICSIAIPTGLQFTFELYQEDAIKIKSIYNERKQRIE